MPLKSLDRKLEIICVGPPHGLTIYQVSAQSDVNCRRSYPETKKFTGEQTDAEGYNIIQPFFKRTDKKYQSSIKISAEAVRILDSMLKFGVLTACFQMCSIPHVCNWEFLQSFILHCYRYKHFNN